MTNSQAPQPAHTPGPLEAIGHVVRTVRNEDGSGGYLVAECSVMQPCREGDARLFAAAPELLEALRDVLLYGTDTNYLAADAAVAQAQAAIRKATGAQA